MVLVICILGDIWMHSRIPLFINWREVKNDGLGTVLSCFLRWALKLNNDSQNEVPHVWIFKRITTLSVAASCSFYHVA